MVILPSWPVCMGVCVSFSCLSTRSFTMLMSLAISFVFDMRAGIDV